ncbi:MAG: rod shape-determining protein MreD [Nocardioidaceae bacterium]
MTAVRLSVVAALLVVATSLQVGIFSQLAIDGVVPDLALLVVIGAALVRGPDYAAVLGFFAGLCLDLAPPADHTAGRWALALVVVGWLAGQVRHDAGHSAAAAVVTVAAGSFIGTSLFALSGLVLGDPGVTVSRVLTVVPLAMLYDVALTPFVLPLLIGLFRRLGVATERW